MSFGEGRWLEMRGCGMVHPNVLRNFGIDPRALSSASPSASGLERLTMLRYGIERPAAVLRERPALPEAVRIAGRMNSPKTGCAPSSIRRSTPRACRALTMPGIEVEALEPAAPRSTASWSGEVLSVEKHPERRPAARVPGRTSARAPLTIVCGAPNVRAGMKVPTALVGAKLPDIEIKAAKLRGVESQGMLCSARELGLERRSSGLLDLPTMRRSARAFASCSISTISSSRSSSRRTAATACRSSAWRAKWPR